MKLKILFISSWFPNKIEPTNGNFVQRHAEAVAKIHEVEVLHAIGDFNQKETYVFDDKIINKIRTLVVYYKNTRNPILNFYRRMKAYQKGFQKMDRPDLVHANVLHNSMIFAVYLKKRFKIPFVVTEHWTALRKSNENITPKNILKTAKFIGNRANCILPVSFDLQKGLKNLGITTTMKVVPNVVDTSLFSVNEEKKNEFVFIHVSNLIPRKNSDKILNTAIRLLKKGHQFKLQLGGDGTQQTIENLKKTAIESGFQDKIEIFGMQSIQEVAERMKRSDCFILFSNDENQPCVIAESFASGLLVISTNVGGVSEFLPENFGILLDFPNENLLEEAMVNILNGEVQHHRNALQSYAERTFSVEKIGEQYSEIYADILKK
ncbi:glycosyltransferase [Amniculibacterium sp. G2-70]|uniref:glycosyltransferase n=1 Tax=Amniculibacterium sp. G2-70 TaxID=2767188 RepID=UPI0016544507|nr:glycosyltransferase [Amniculibacterium sp. G2-70]